MTTDRALTPATSGTMLFDPSIVSSKHEGCELITSILQASTEFSIIGRDLAGVIVLWNEGARRAYGYEAEEVVGKANCNILHVPEQVEAGLSDSITRAAIRDGRWEGTLARVRRNGEQFSARVVITPRRDAMGNAIGALLVSRDISDELSFAKEHVAQVYARSLIEASLDPFVTISPAGKITDVNRASEQVTGLTREKLIGTDFSDYFTEPEKAREGYQRVFSEGFVRDYALAIRHSSGAITDVLYNASVYKDDKGAVRGVFAAARDVTERKRFEQSLLKADRMKSEFLAGMSHELRTPLNGIIGFTEFLVDEKPGPLTPKQKEYLNDVLSSACHLLQLINDVLDLAKVDSGKLVLHPEVFPVSRAIGEVTAIMNGNAGKKRIAVIAKVGPDLDEVLLDQSKFKQILYNLLSNAIKFTDTGGRVDIEARRAAGDHLELCVRDTGIGIRAEDMPRLFSEFEQLDSGPGRHYEGTGLGLALTKRIVEFQDGQIDVQSEPGKGSAFTVILPLTGREIERK